MSVAMWNCHSWPLDSVGMWNFHSWPGNVSSNVKLYIWALHLKTWPNSAIHFKWALIDNIDQQRLLLLALAVSYGGISENIIWKFELISGLTLASQRSFLWKTNNSTMPWIIKWMNLQLIKHINRLNSTRYRGHYKTNWKPDIYSNQQENKRTEQHQNC